MKNINLEYEINKVDDRVLGNINNRDNLLKYLDKKDSDNIETKLNETLKYINDICNQDKYNLNPKDRKILNSAKLVLGFKNYQLHLDEYDKKILERYKDVDKIDIRDLDLSLRTFNCLKALDVYTFGDVLNLGEKSIVKVRNFGKKSMEDLRGAVFKWAPEKYDEYVNKSGIK